MKISMETRARFEQWRAWVEPMFQSLDWSEEAMQDFYARTTHGVPIPKAGGIFHVSVNGYLKAEEVINFHITEWRNDFLAGNLFKFEIFEDEKIPQWLRDQFRKACEGHQVEHFMARDYLKQIRAEHVRKQQENQT